LAKNRSVNTGKDATQAEKRKKNIKVIRALIEDEFAAGGNNADVYSQPTTIDIESVIRRTEIELPSYELKQGILRLADKRELDDCALERIIHTIAAIANNGPNVSGKIILGVADKMDDVKRIVKLDQIQPRTVGKRSVVGINREARALGKSVEEYFQLIRDRIRKSGLSEPLRGDTLSHLEFNTFYDLGVLVISIPKQSDISYCGEQVYYRDGDQTKEAEGARRVAEISKRFQRPH
jgi:predicted HTH transcriptional regulator